ncbi:hypothetical protein [Tenacibaculum finnmarkense]|nr:hypothetical protein [Tenacibaculum finnmarkense]MCG8721862.1 hypothetical protein [Tenacibaculum finnmarkense]
MKNEKTEKQGVTEKRLKSGWNEAWRLKVLNIKVWVYSAIKNEFYPN